MQSFIGHSRAITGILVHPYSDSQFITCSQDGTIRIWSLQTMGMVYKVHAGEGKDGVCGMNFSDDNFLFSYTRKKVSIWNLNYVSEFWSPIYTVPKRVHLVGGHYTNSIEKSTRILMIGEDFRYNLF